MIPTLILILDPEEQYLKKKCFSVTYYCDHFRKSTAMPKTGGNAKDWG